jgi:hypothetical protein
MDDFSIDIKYYVTISRVHIDLKRKCNGPYPWSSKIDIRRVNIL